MRFRHRHLACLLGLMLPLWGGEGWREPFLPAAKVQGEREGLPNLTIQQIVQDPQGRLWAATQDGVAVCNPVESKSQQLL